jgi:hypothetical protein
MHLRGIVRRVPSFAPDCAVILDYPVRTPCRCHLYGKAVVGLNRGMVRPMTAGGVPVL